MFRGLHTVRRMAAQIVPEVEIDPNGTFKYILIQLNVTDKSGASCANNIVRGYAECPYHSEYSFINDSLLCTFCNVYESSCITNVDASKIISWRENFIFV